MCFGIFEQNDTELHLLEKRCRRNTEICFKNGFNENKKEEIKVRNITSKNITLPKSNMLPSFSERYM